MFTNADEDLQLPNENGQGSFDTRLLHSMMLKKDDDVYEFLKDKRHLAKLVDCLGRTLLHYAAEYGCNRTVTLLASKSEIDRKDHQGKTAFELATTSETINFLLGDIGFVDVDNENGRRMMNYFLDQRERFDEKGDHFSLTNMELGVNVDKIAEKLIDFKYSIHSVLKFRRAEVTRIMLERGSPFVNPNSSLCPGDVLVLAIRSNDFANARVLIDYGVDVNAENSRGQTPLSSFIVCNDADHNQRLEILRLLLERGANPTKIISENSFGEAAPGAMQIAPILKYESKEIIRELLNVNFDLNAKDEKGRTTIHYMASNNRPDVFAELKGREYDANARDKDGSTPLHLINRCHLDTARALHLRGADVNAVDHEGKTVLMRIWKNSGCNQWGCLSRLREARVIEYLLCHGANPHVIAPDQRFSIFFCDYYKDDRLAIVLKRLSIIEARGTPIVKDVEKEINHYIPLKQMFDAYKEELEKMRKMKILKSISVYDLLTRSKVEIERYVRNRQFHRRLHRLKKRINYLDHYAYVLRSRLEKSIKVSRMRKQATADLSEALELCQLVAGKIASYLSESDLQKIVLICKK